MIVRRLALAALLALVGAVPVAACGTDAVGVDSCRQIEEARCGRAPGCGIALQPPYFTAGSAVDACIRYYDDACLHGLDVADPGQTAVSACVAAVKSGACSIVQKPETSAACVWLVPPVQSSPPDASEATTGTSDGSAGG